MNICPNVSCTSVRGRIFFREYVTGLKRVARWKPFGNVPPFVFVHLTFWDFPLKSTLKGLQWQNVFPAKREGE